MESLSEGVIWFIGGLLFVYFLFVTWIGRKGAKYSKTMSGFATARAR
ncbi:hypothetical protein MUO14_19425 [Halobacillus shinanisalinarum]|uniref:Uncharacterized protein n=1 Tax=Halobacillus shinanisalinarum TaxID=2932258 RepID=A0ABY4GXE8_9BACI|nr:hypothetical protein [Halobacillus shinanisalinarum]UOQ92594.1 hypothetical protein MUO14_19425 [Halobacillus shinanisalinarum]